MRMAHDVPGIPTVWRDKVGRQANGWCEFVCRETAQRRLTEEKEASVPELLARIEKGGGVKRAFILPIPRP